MITLTDNASLKVKELLAQEGEDNLMLRVAVRPGGCSGFSYEMFFDSELETDDLTLDYSDGLQGAGFAIDNPNAQKTCGCGNSFS